MIQLKCQTTIKEKKMRSSIDKYIDDLLSHQKSASKPKEVSTKVAVVSNQKKIIKSELKKTEEFISKDQTTKITTEISQIIIEENNNDLSLDCVGNSLDFDHF